RICLKALAVAPEQRYHSAAKMEGALRAYLRRPRLLLGAAAGLVGLLAVVLALTLPPASNPAGLPPGGDTTEGRPSVPRLRGELWVRLGPKVDPGKTGRRIGPDDGALPSATASNCVSRQSSTSRLTSTWLGWTVRGSSRLSTPGTRATALRKRAWLRPRCCCP